MFLQPITPHNFLTCVPVPKCLRVVVWLPVRIVVDCCCGCFGFFSQTYSLQKARGRRPRQRRRLRCRPSLTCMTGLQPLSATSSDYAGKKFRISMALPVGAVMCVLASARAAVSATVREAQKPVLQTLSAPFALSPPLTSRAGTARTIRVLRTCTLSPSVRLGLASTGACIGREQTGDGARTKLERLERRHL